MYKKPELSQQARILAAQIKDRCEVALPHQAALEVIARLYGYRDWHSCVADQTPVLPMLPQTVLRQKALQHVMRLVFTQLGPWAGKEDRLLDALRDAAFEEDWSLADQKARALFDLGELVQSDDYALRLEELVPCIERQARATEDLLKSLANPVEPEADRVVLNETVYDWRLAEGEDLAELPEEDRQPYQVRITRNTAQFFVDISIPHTDPEDIDGTPCLSMFIEINEGKPCVHMTNDMYGDQLLSVFAIGEGLIVRKNDSTVSFEDATSHPFGQRVEGHWLVR